MSIIKSVIEALEPSYEQRMLCLEEIREDGNVVVVKLDGARKEDHYTVFVSFPKEPHGEIFRADESDLKAAIVKVLREYEEKTST